MASTIGKASLIVTAETKGVETSLRNAAKSFLAFNVTVTKGLSVMASGFTGFALAAARAITDLFADFQTIALEMDRIAKQSRALGLDTQFFSALTHAANLSGVSMSQLSGGLRQMLNLAGQVRIGNLQAARAFQAVGISIEQLRNLEGEALFYEIADGIAAIQNPVERTQAAMALFGTDASQMITLLERGSAGVREMVAEAERLGIAFNAVEAARIESANDAITRMQASFRGLQQTFVIALAPTVERFANFITRIQTALAPALQVVARVVETIFDVIAQAFGQMNLDAVLDNLAEWVPDMEEVRAITIQALKAMSMAVASFADSVVDLGGLFLDHFIIPALRGIQELIRQINQMMRQFGQIANAVGQATNNPLLGQSFASLSNAAGNATNEVQDFIEIAQGWSDTISNVPSAATGVNNFFSNLNDSIGNTSTSANRASTALNLLNQDIANFNRELSQQIATIGLSSEMVRVWELRQRGATDAMLEMTQALIAQREGAQLTFDMMSPAEELQRELTRLQRLILRGAISWQTYGRAVAAAFAEHVGPQQLPTAQAFQSSGAVETIIRARVQNDQGNPVQRVLEQTRQLQEQQLQAQQDIARQAAAQVGLLASGFGGLNALANQAAQQPVGLGFALGGLAAIPGLPGQPLPVGPAALNPPVPGLPGQPGQANQGNANQGDQVSLLRQILLTTKDILREIRNTPAPVTI